MLCEQCTFSQEPVVDSLPTSSLDIPQWLQSNGNHTLVESLENVPLKDGFPSWLSGKVMSETSTHPNTPDEWIASMRDSLAKTLALLENKQVLGKEHARGFTEKSCELLASLDPAASSWKMSPQLSQTVLNKLSKTWPSWGMTVGGCAYEHPMSGHRITATDGFYWVTPTARDWKGHTITTNYPNGYNRTLPNAVIMKSREMFPTPTAHNAIEQGYPSQLTRNTVQLGDLAGGKLNPNWVEWLMGWPIGHTASKQLETVKSPSKSRQRLPSWLRSKK
jgi:hypothetical protein